MSTTQLFTATTSLRTNLSLADRSKVSKFIALTPPHFKFTLSSDLHHFIVIIPHLQFPLSVHFIQSQFPLTPSPSIDQFTSTPLTFNLLHFIPSISPTALCSSCSSQLPLSLHFNYQQQSQLRPTFFFLIAHTPHIIHSALISLLLSLHAIRQLKLSPTQLFRTHHFYFASHLFPLIIPTFHILPIPYYQHYSHFLISINSTFTYGPYLIISIDATFTTLTPFVHTLFSCNCYPIPLTNMTQIVSISHHTYSTHTIHIKDRFHSTLLPFVPL